MEKSIKKNREKFSEGKRRLDFLPKKYFEKFQQNCPETDYDHPMLYRDKEFDYLIISLYSGIRNEEVLVEGFEEIPPMYSTGCRSYVKRFRNNRTNKVEDV